MSRTANLRRQHDAAEELVGEISAVLDCDRPSETEAYALGLKLAKLTGLLRIHFAQEDRMLYPQMVNSTHTDAQQTAALFQCEMGDLGPVYLAFADRWVSGRAIAAGFAAFRHEATGVFAALADRIHRENTVLYPLADAIGPEHQKRVA